MIANPVEYADAPKKATNLSLNAKVLQAARELGINLSQTVDELLAREVARLTVQRWAAENPNVIAKYNQRVETEGLFNSDLRKLRGQI